MFTLVQDKEREQDPLLPIVLVLFSVPVTVASPCVNKRFIRFNPFVLKNKLLSQSHRVNSTLNIHYIIVLDIFFFRVYRRDLSGGKFSESE